MARIGGILAATSYKMFHLKYYLYTWDSQNKRKLLFVFYSSLERDFPRAEPVSTVQRVRVTEHILPTVLSAADKQSSTISGIQDLEQLERRMLLQEVKEIRQKSRQSLMEPILEESELAFRSV
jgi:hypothetical protein